MTPSAVGKLVAKWREEGEMDTSIGSLGIPALLRAADELESALRQEDQARERIEQLEVQLAGCMTAATGWAKNPPKKGDWGWSQAFQDVLDSRNKHDARLATAPPEQGALPAKLTLEDITTALDYASEGRNWRGVKPDLLGNQLNRVLARLADEVPIIHGQAELAAHDQKVRAEVLTAVLEILTHATCERPEGKSWCKYRTETEFCTEQGGHSGPHKLQPHLAKRMTEDEHDKFLINYAGSGGDIQAVSAGALELAEKIFNDFVSPAAAAAFARAHSSKWNDFDSPCYINGIAALLAANDQKVRAEVLEEAAQEAKKYGLGHEGDSIAAAIRRLRFPVASGAEEK